MHDGMRIIFGGFEVYIRREDYTSALKRAERHFHRLRRIAAALAPLARATTQSRLNAEEGDKMRTFDDLDAAYQAIDTVTNTIADDVAKTAANEQKQIEELTALRDQVKNGSPVTASQFDALVARAEQHKAAMDIIEQNLRPLAADQSNPVPEPTPVPDPGVGGDEV